MARRWDSIAADTSNTKCMVMQKITLPLLISLIALTGCAHHYVMKLTDGAQITTASKPKLKEGVYFFKDAKGEEHAVGAARVREIAPASMVERENKPKPMKSDSQKKRKWYFLWLA
jgi:hypothetical protein